MRTRLLLIAWLAGTAAIAAAEQAPARGSTEPISVHARARAQQPGELVVITVTTVEPARAVHIRAFDRPWPAFSTGSRTWRALVGIDLDTAPGSYTIAIDADATSGTARLSYPLVVRKKVFPTRRLTVDEAFVTPPAAVVPRIEADARRLEECWKRSADSKLWTGPFARPVPQPANSAFGTRSVYNGKPRSPHGGADFLSPAGTPVHAPNSGRIVLAQDLYFTGNTIVIDHGLGLFSLFAHLSDMTVEEGVNVSTDDVIGRVGATGRVTGPHLHWAVRAGGARVDPLSLIASLGSDQ